MKRLTQWLTLIIVTSINIANYGQEATELLQPDFAKLSTQDKLKRFINALQASENFQNYQAIIKIAKADQALLKEMSTADTIDSVVASLRKQNLLGQLSDWIFVILMFSEFPGTQAWLKKQLQQNQFTKNDLQQFVFSLINGPYFPEVIIKALKTIFALDISVNIQNNVGYTPLMQAINNQQEQIITFLLKNYPKIDLKISGTDGRTALDLAQATGNKKIIDLIKKTENKNNQ
ncbi:MAG: ankyrin repeat domain-containing protein [Candidatus Babeliales bacterium]